MMKAIRIHEYGGLEQVRYEDVPVPQVNRGEVLARVHAASVNPVDYKLAFGALRAYIPLNLPWVPGGNFSGVVEAVGPGVTGVNKGDAVYGNRPNGGHTPSSSAPRLARLRPNLRSSATSKPPRCRSRLRRPGKVCSTTGTCRAGKQC